MSHISCKSQYTINFGFSNFQPHNYICPNRHKNNCGRMTEKKIIIVVIAAILISTLITIVPAVFLDIQQDENKRAYFIAADFEAILYHDNSSPDNRNENLTIMIKVDTGYFRNVGASENGFRVEITNAVTGLGPFTADVMGQTNYSQGFVEKSGVWDVMDNKGIQWNLKIPVSTIGRFENVTTAYLYLWADNNTSSDADNSKIDPEQLVLWYLGNLLSLRITCHDDIYTVGCWFYCRVA